MSTTDILAELPALPPNELEAIWETAGRLLEGQSLSASPELLAAIDEADSSWEQEGGVPIAEAQRKFGV